MAKSFIVIGLKKTGYFLFNANKAFVDMQMAVFNNCICSLIVNRLFLNNVCSISVASFKSSLVEQFVSSQVFWQSHAKEVYAKINCLTF